MDLWQTAAELINQLVERHAALTMFVLVFLEECGLPLPVPSDVVIVLIGSRLGFAEGKLNPITTFLLALAATLLGATILYILGRRGGRPLLHRFGRFVHLKPAALDKAEVQVQKHGLWAVMFGRWIPGLRIVTVVAAGSLGVPYRQFIVALTVSSSVYLAVVFGLGYFFGGAVLEQLKVPQLTWGLVLNLALLAALIFFTVRSYQDRAMRRRLGEHITYRRRPEIGLLAGALATFETTLALHVTFDFLAYVGPGINPVGISLLTDLFGSFGVVEGALGLYMIGGAVWGVLYALVFQPILPGTSWRRGLIFALVPWAVSVLVFMPLAGLGWFGFGVGWQPLLIEALRHIVFGVALGSNYSMFSVANRKPSGSTDSLPTIKPEETSKAN